MKIVIDTDKLKDNLREGIVQQKRFMENYSDREVFFLCIIIVVFGYMVSDYLDSKKFTYLDKRVGSVEVTLERIQDRLNRDAIQEEDIESSNEVNSLPRTKHPQLFNTKKKVSLSKKEFDCLARNIYWETMREPLIGQLAVAQITSQRVSTGKWGNSFCSVVFAPKQFSWTNFRKIRNATPRNEKQWIRARHSAFLFTKGVRVTNLDNSHFYFADYIKAPKWSKGMDRIAQIGRHIFYADSGMVAQGDVEN